MVAKVSNDLAARYFLLSAQEAGAERAAPAAAAASGGDRSGGGSGGTAASRRSAFLSEDDSGAAAPVLQSGELAAAVGKSAAEKVPHARELIQSTQQIWTPLQNIALITSTPTV